MYIIAVPKDKVTKSIYYSYDAGARKELPLINGKKLYDTNEILHTFDTNLEFIDDYYPDDTQFVLVMTEDLYGGSNPKSGIKIERITGIEQKKLDKFDAKKKMLFEKITKSYYEKGTVTSLPPLPYFERIRSLFY